jgi:transcriptional regulator with XRE-family HTH domain
MVRKNDYIQEIDQFVGDKIYSIRLAKGLSRQQLAEVIGVTHQQLQKYEKGVNRISVGRLVLIAKALGKNINYFYEGIESNDTEPILTQHQRMCIEVSRNFMKIRSTDHQNAVNMLVRSLVKESA